MFVAMKHLYEKICFVVGVACFTPFSSGHDDSDKLINISTRAWVGTGENVMIGGFVVEGTQQVLIQALGPELVNRGISNALADPVLTVTNTTDPTNPMMVNDNWEDSQGELISDLWADGLPLTSGSLSSAAVLTLEPGNYTGKVEGKDGTTGVALIEVYEIDDAAASDAVTVVTAGATGDDYQYVQEHVAFIDGDDDDSFGLSRTLPAGSQTIHLNFEVQLELPDNLPSSRTLSAWVGLGQDADFWAKSGNDVFFGIGLDPGNAFVKVKEQPMADTTTSFESELSRAAARVSLEIATPNGFRTDGDGELRYTCTIKVDFDRDGQTDVTSTGSFMDSRWGLNLWLGLERWWSGAKDTAGEQPLRVSLNLRPQT